MQTGKKPSFARLLGIRPHDFVTAVGGGGKTSLLEKLTAELAAEKKKVLLTTTTNMYLPDESLYTVFLRNGEEAAHYAGRIADCPDTVVFAGEYLVAENKVKGAENDLPDLLYAEIPGRTFLCEGDGSAGHSFKIFRDYEPVIPKAATRLFFVVGADVWQKPCSEVVFRCPERCAGQMFDETFWREELGRSLAKIRTMFGGQIDLLINKAEGERRAGAMEMARLAQPLAEQVWICSLREGRLEKAERGEG